jgi:hypothetical protein
MEAGNPPRVMRIIPLYPSADWERKWTNLHECCTTEAVKINWCMVIQDILPTNVVIQDILPTNVVIQDILPTNVVIQDILPTNERLHKIRLVYSQLCGHCGEPDTVQQR